MFAIERIATSPIVSGGSVSPASSITLSSTPGRAMPAERMRGLPAGICRRQIGDGAASLRHAVLLAETAAEHRHALAQQVERNRQGAIEDVFEPAVIDFAGARLVYDDLQRRRHHEHFGDLVAFDEI